MTTQPSFFGSFNARQLSSEEVGSTFVAPPQYSDLCQAQHTLLLGPRGSGKTTLLKMLTAPALRAWSKSRGEPAKPLAFHGVYVPADILWSSQLQDLTLPNVDQTTKELLSKAAVTVNVQYALIEAFEDLRQLAEPDESELKAAKDIAEAWSLGQAFPSFYGLRRALRDRLAEVRAFAARLGHQPPQGDGTPVFPNHIYSDFFDVAGVAIERLHHHLRLPRTQRWALCFDELEISPEWLRNRLLELLRSSDARFLFKLSASPLQSGAIDSIRMTAAQESQDYSVVRLWYSSTVEARDFCHRLAQAVLSRGREVAVDPRDVLGHSAFAHEQEGLFRTTSPYQEGTAFWKTLQRAAFYDPSLRTLLKEKNIDLARPRSIAASDRDQLLRKIKPVLMLRDEFRAVGSDTRKRQIRSRKRTILYSGAEALYALSDGNPRWLIGMLNEMITRSKSRDRISREIQAEITWKASQRFRVLLSMLPQSTQTMKGKEVSLVDLLDDIGKHFFDRIVRGPFPLDPVGSFVVDSLTDEGLVDLIKLGVSQGALINVDTDWKVLAMTPRGKRFRLSFLLAPTYRVPLRLYDAVPLRIALRTGLRARQFGEEPDVTVHQSELFGSTSG